MYFKTRDPGSRNFCHSAWEHRERLWQSSGKALVTNPLLSRFAAQHSAAQLCCVPCSQLSLSGPPQEDRHISCSSTVPTPLALFLPVVLSEPFKDFSPRCLACEQQLCKVEWLQVKEATSHLMCEPKNFVAGSLLRPPCHLVNTQIWECTHSATSFQHSSDGLGCCCCLGGSREKY